MAAGKDCTLIPKSGDVRVDTAEERSYWARAFGVSESVLLQAVQIVGRSVTELRKLFCRE